MEIVLPATFECTVNYSNSKYMNRITNYPGLQVYRLEIALFSEVLVYFLRPHTRCRRLIYKMFVASLVV